MEAKEEVPRESLDQNVSGISDVQPAATTGALMSAGGRSGEGWDDLNKVFQRPVKYLNVPKNIDPEGHFKPQQAAQFLQVPAPAPQQDAVVQEDVIRLMTESPRIMRHREVELLCRELELQQPWTRGELAARDQLECTDHVEALQRSIVTDPGVEVQYTGTAGPRIARINTLGGAIDSSNSKKVPTPTLELRSTSQAAVVEKALKDEAIVAVNLDSFNEGSSSSDTSQY